MIIQNRPSIVQRLKDYFAAVSAGSERNMLESLTAQIACRKLSMKKLFAIDAVYYGPIRERLAHKEIDSTGYDPLLLAREYANRFPIILTETLKAARKQGETIERHLRTERASAFTSGLLSIFPEKERSAIADRLMRIDMASVNRRMGQFGEIVEDSPLDPLVSHFPRK